MASNKKKEEGSSEASIIAELERKYGMQKMTPKQHTIVSTGSLQLNQAMGIGGTAVGKLIEIFGPESSGKSTLTLHQIAEYQQAFPEKRVVLFDYEHSFDMKYARNLGVDVDRLLIYQPDTMEDGYDMLIGMIEKDLISCAVIDSQTAAPPKAILEGEIGDSTIGLQARINSKFCMKMKGLLSVHNCSLFIISQTRDKIGSMGEPTGTTGGNALKFYADARWKVWKMNDKENDRNKTTVDVIKNKMDCPFGQAKFNIVWGHGVDKLGELVEYAIEYGIINRAGSWISYKELKVQGLETFKDCLEENPDVLLEIESLVISHINEDNIGGLEVYDPEIVEPYTKVINQIN